MLPEEEARDQKPAQDEKKIHADPTAALPAGNQSGGGNGQGEMPSHDQQNGRQAEQVESEIPHAGLIGIFTLLFKRL
jgi:hypothetical protein